MLLSIERANPLWCPKTNPPTIGGRGAWWLVWRLPVKGGLALRAGDNGDFDSWRVAPIPW